MCVCLSLRQLPPPICSSRGKERLPRVASWAPPPPPSPWLSHLAPTPGPAVAMVGDRREGPGAETACGLLLCMEIIRHPVNPHESGSAGSCYQL